MKKPTYNLSDQAITLKYISATHTRTERHEQWKYIFEISLNGHLIGEREIVNINNQYRTFLDVQKQMKSLFWKEMAYTEHNHRCNCIDVDKTILKALKEEK